MKWNSIYHPEVFEFIIKKQELLLHSFLRNTLPLCKKWTHLNVVSKNEECLSLGIPFSRIYGVDTLLQPYSIVVIMVSEEEMLGIDRTFWESCFDLLGHPVYIIHLKRNSGVEKCHLSAKGGYFTFSSYKEPKIPFKHLPDRELWRCMFSWNELDFAWPLVPCLETSIIKVALEAQASMPEMILDTSKEYSLV